MRIPFFVFLAIGFGLAGGAKADMASAERQLRAGLHDMAAREFLSEALKGNAEAMHRLAELCEQGIGVEQNLLDAKRWYMRASQRGHRPAETSLKRLSQAH